MLELIIDISKNNSCKIENGTLFCSGYLISDYQKINTLENDGVLENSISEIRNGEVIDLELTLARLHQYGFYENCDAFLSKNLYELQTEVYFIYELNCHSNESHDFTIKHASIVKFINAIEKIAKHTYQDADVRSSILFREDKSAFLPICYLAKDVNAIENLENLDKVTLALKEENSERKLLFLNELIEVINNEPEEQRFSGLLLKFEAFYNKCENAYQFYLRNFSYNKLKLELDSKALEYTQKIQGVINDAQTKLIAIPTAFVLVFTVLDFTNIISMKNIGTIISLFIFAFLIQLFLNNQKSTLKFIEQNIKSYTDTFAEKEIEKISEKFELVGIELKKQKTRLRITEIILWLIPVLLICLWLYLAYSQIISMVAFSILSSILIFLPKLSNVFLK